MAFQSRFPAVLDISSPDSNTLDINELDQQMIELFRSVRFAISQDVLLSRNCSELRSSLDDLMLQFLHTHNSIRLLIGNAYRETNYPAIADTGSLVREQIEKIYVVVTLLQNPKKWIRQYLRNAWRQDFEQFLLLRAEFGKIERWTGFLRQLPADLDTLRHPQIPRGGKQKRVITVSNFAKRCVNFQWHHPDGPAPKWYKRKRRKFKGYLNEYFHFPTPWNSVEFARHDSSYFQFLDRWYREYKFYSAYSHVFLKKMVLVNLSRKKDSGALQRLQDYGERRAEEFVLVSNTVGATLCVLILSRLSNDFGSKAEARQFWEPLSNFSLLSKSLWNIYAKQLLS